jgi:hypothetical protein
MRVNRVVLLAFVVGGVLAASAGTANGPYASIPADKRETLKMRISEYVDSSQSRNWGKLYDLVSDTGRGDTSREAFIARMKQAHGVSFANYPDLFRFVPARNDKSEDGGFDLYGCGEARREGENYKALLSFTSSSSMRTGFLQVGRSMEWRTGHVPDWRSQVGSPSTRLSWKHVMEELR